MVDYYQILFATLGADVLIASYLIDKYIWRGNPRRRYAEELWETGMKYRKPSGSKLGQIKQYIGFRNELQKNTVRAMLENSDKLHVPFGLILESQRRLNETLFLEEND